MYSAVALRFTTSLGVLMLVLFLRGDEALGLGLTVEFLPVMLAMTALGTFAAHHRCEQIAHI